MTIRLFFAIGALAVPLTAATGAPLTGRIAYVTDGDTFRLESGERIRIAGIDAPELHRNQAKCAREVERGQDARRRAIALLNGKTVEVTRPDVRGAA